jgi:hypothetical protein
MVLLTMGIMAGAPNLLKLLGRIGGGCAYPAGLNRANYADRGGCNRVSVEMIPTFAVITRRSPRPSPTPARWPSESVGIRHGRWTILAKYSRLFGTAPLTLYQPVLTPTGYSLEQKKKCPRLFTGGKYTGRFTSGRRGGQRPLSSDWRWNSGGSAAVTDDPL